MAIGFITMDTSTEFFGQMGGLTLDGNFIFGALVIIVNIKVLIGSYQYTFWSVFWIVLSIASFFGVFAMFSYLQTTSVYGELTHTYIRYQTWCVLIFCTASYILIDSGMELVNSEIVYFMAKRRDEIRREKSKKLLTDTTLDRRRIVTFKSKLAVFQLL